MVKSHHATTDLYFLSILHMFCELFQIDYSISANLVSYLVTSPFDVKQAAS